MTPKATAARAKRHLESIRVAAGKFSFEYQDVDTYLEHRGDEIIAKVDEIRAEIAEWVKEQAEKT